MPIQLWKIIGASALLVATTAGWSSSLVYTNGANGWLIAVGASLYALVRAMRIQP